jgi:hypothetical protein
MANDSSLLQRPGFDLDTAVFLAEASSVAYGTSDKVDAWALSQGFTKSASFDSGDVQGFWCARDDATLLMFRGTSNHAQWLRDVRFFPSSHPWGHVHIGFRDGVAGSLLTRKPFVLMAHGSKPSIGRAPA